jgi:CheY-like chemotaxis protein
MGGTLSVESTPGRGSTFRFQVVLRPAPVRCRERQAPWLCRAPRRLRILLVEDNATNRLVASRTLERMGHRVDAVADGWKAVETVRSIPYDLVLMDVMMPQMDGLTATRLIRAERGAFSRTPIVGLTADAERNREVACREAGMDGFVGKPVTAERLARVIEGIMAACDGDAAMTDGCPMLDEAVLLRLSDDIGPSNTVDVVRLFLDEAPRVRGRLDRAIATRDRTLLREVHTLASAARSVGLQRVGQAAADAEAQLSVGEGAADVLASLPVLLQQSVALLAEWEAQPHAPAQLFATGQIPERDRTAQHDEALFQLDQPILAP